jgi:hypothetical protein
MRPLRSPVHVLPFNMSYNVDTQHRYATHACGVPNYKFVGHIQLCQCDTLPQLERRRELSSELFTVRPALSSPSVDLDLADEYSIRSEIPVDKYRLDLRFRASRSPRGYSHQKRLYPGSLIRSFSTSVNGVGVGSD